MPPAVTDMPDAWLSASIMSVACQPDAAPRRAMAVAAVLALSACAAPPPAAPDPTGLASADMLLVLTAYHASGARPVAGLTVAQARNQPTIADAAVSVAQQAGVPAKMIVAEVTDIEIQGAAGPLAARVYNPKTAHSPAPVILYFHGGGWVTGTLDTDDASDRALAEETGAIVVSVAYRLAPEARFPAAQDDANASYRWLLENAAGIGADPKRIALAGDSAGGNLAIDTAIWARDSGMPAPLHQLLIYPVVGTDLTTQSYAETANAVPLNRAAVQWYLAHFTGSAADLRDRRLNVIADADLHGLPPTTIVSAQIDPLRSEGEALGQKLQASGVPVEQRTYPGVTHEFFGMGATVVQARQAEEFAAMRLDASFAAAAPPAPKRHVRHRHHTG